MEIIDLVLAGGLEGSVVRPDVRIECLETLGLAAFNVASDLHLRRRVRRVRVVAVALAKADVPQGTFRASQLCEGLLSQLEVGSEGQRRGLVFTLQRAFDVYVGRHADLDLPEAGLVGFQRLQRLHRLVDVALAHHVIEPGQPRLSAALYQGLQRHERHSYQVVALRDFKVIVSGGLSLVENFKLQIASIIEPLLVGGGERHRDVRRAIVPGGVAVGLYAVSLDEHPRLLGFKGRLHVDQRVGGLRAAQRVLNPHSVIYFEVQLDFFRFFTLLHLLSHFLLSEGADVSAGLVHKLREFAEHDDVVEVAGLQAVGN
mmetsp:Transcript_34710/g.53247  ORF Transcript_34710/g.53247 Transcript_34710/m.53247 type:complete len:315 (-) Transcript_34710:6883-7827(-)